MSKSRWVDRCWQLAFRAGYILAMGYWAVRSSRLWGVGVAVWWNHQLLLIDNSYKRDRCIPGGGVHSGETPAGAAARELAEEAGIRVDVSALIHAGTYKGYVDFKRDEITIFEVILDTKPSVHVDHREVIAAGFVTMADAMNQRLNPMIRSYLRDCLSVGGPLTSMRSTNLSQESP